MTATESILLTQKVTASGHELKVIVKPGHKLMGQEVWVITRTIDAELFEYLHGIYKEWDLMAWTIVPADERVAFVFQ